MGTNDKQGVITLRVSLPITKEEVRWPCLSDFATEKNIRGCVRAVFNAFPICRKCGRSFLAVTRKQFRFTYCQECYNSRLKSITKNERAMLWYALKFGCERYNEYSFRSLGKSVPVFKNSRNYNPRTCGNLLAKGLLAESKSKNKIVVTVLGLEYLKPPKRPVLTNDLVQLARYYGS